MNRVEQFKAMRKIANSNPNKYKLVMIIKDKTIISWVLRELTEVIEYGFSTKEDYRKVKGWIDISCTNWWDMKQRMEVFVP